MIKLRNFGKKDKASLENLLKQLLSDSIELEVEKLAKDPNFIGIIAEDNGKVVGFGSISFFNSIVKKRTGVIEDVIVDEKYRGKGLGRKILQELERQSRENNAKLITLTSNPARVPAHRLYESEGFEKRDTGFYQKKM